MSALSVLGGFILVVVVIVVAVILWDQRYWWRQKRKIEEATNVTFPMTNVNVVTNPTQPLKTNSQQDASEPPNSTP